MENILIVLNVEDIPVARQVSASLESYKAYCFDPILLDRMIVAGLAHAELITWDNCVMYGALDAWAHNAAAELETELAAVAREVMPEVSIDCWQHLNLYYLFMAVKWYGVMWQALGSHFQGHKLHLFICNNPLAYYFNSFVPSVLLLNYATSNGIEFAGYTYGEKESITDVVMNLPGVRPASDEEFLLAHMPTCMYDIHYFNREMQASGKRIVNLDAKYFNMPVWGHETFPVARFAQMLPHLPPGFAARLPELRFQLLTKLDTLLRPHIPTNHYRVRQCEHISEIYAAQIMSYGLLEQYFAQCLPSKLLTSDHDCDFHGPLISFAEHHHLPVLFVPHSKTTSDVFFKYKNITCHTHPIQGDVIVTPSGRLLSNPKINFPENFRFTTSMPGGIRKVALLLQVISLNGIYVTRYGPYIDGVKKMVAWCRKHQLAFSIRCKPSYSIIKLLSEETGVDGTSLIETANMPMAEYAEASDLCLMYDSPTSAEMEFLTRGIPVLNPIPKPLVNIESMVCNPQVVPRDTMDEMLRQATVFVNDPVSLEQFRRKQFRDYLNLFQNAQALRVFL